MVLIKPGITKGNNVDQLNLNVKVTPVSQFILRLRRGLWRFKFTVVQRVARSELLWLNLYVIAFQVGLAILWRMKNIRGKAVFLLLFYKLKILNFGIFQYNTIVYLELLVIVFNIVFIATAFKVAERYLFGLFPFFMFVLLMLNILWLKVLIVKQGLL